MYVCAWVSKFSWFDKYFSEFCGTIPIILVLILNVATSVDLFAKLMRKLQATKEETESSNISQSRFSTRGVTKARVANDSKISIVLILLAVFFVIFVGGGNVLRHYLHYGLPKRNNFRLRKLLLILNTSCYAMNGSINGFILLIFPSMRQALLIGIKQIFRRLKCAGINQ